MIINPPSYVTHVHHNYLRELRVVIMHLRLTSTSKSFPTMPYSHRTHHAQALQFWAKVQLTHHHRRGLPRLAPMKRMVSHFPGRAWLSLILVEQGPAASKHICEMLCGGESFHDGVYFNTGALYWRQYNMKLASALLLRYYHRVPYL